MKTCLPLTPSMIKSTARDFEAHRDWKQCADLNATLCIQSNSLFDARLTPSVFQQIPNYIVIMTIHLQYLLSLWVCVGAGVNPS